VQVYNAKSRMKLKIQQKKIELRCKIVFFSTKKKNTTKEKIQQQKKKN